MRCYIWSTWGQGDEPFFIFWTIQFWIKFFVNLVLDIDISLTLDILCYILVLDFNKFLTINTLLSWSSTCKWPGSWKALWVLLSCMGFTPVINPNNLRLEWGDLPRMPLKVKKVKKRRLFWLIPCLPQTLCVASVGCRETNECSWFGVHSASKFKVELVVEFSINEKYPTLHWTPLGASSKSLKDDLNRNNYSGSLITLIQKC